MLSKITISLILFVLTFVNTKAQTCDTVPQMLQQITASPLKLYYVQYDGTPYIYSDWREADILLNGGEVYKNQKVKVDLFLDELVYFNHSLNKQLIVDKEIINKVTFVDDVVSSEIGLTNECERDSNDNCSFYFIHLEDSISLWSRQIKKVEIYNEPSNGYSKIGKYFLRKKHFYVINNQLHSISISKRSFVKSFPTFRKELLVLIRKNGYSMKRSEDLVEVFKYINQVKSNK